MSFDPSTCDVQRWILEYLHENKNKQGFDSTPFTAHIMKLYNEACVILLNNRVDREAIAKVFYSWFKLDQAIYIRYTWNSYKNDPLVVELALKGAEDSLVNDGEVNQKLIDEYIAPLAHLHPVLFHPKQTAAAAICDAS